MKMKEENAKFLKVSQWELPFCAIREKSNKTDNIKIKTSV